MERKKILRTVPRETKPKQNVEPKRDVRLVRKGPELDLQDLIDLPTPRTDR